MCIRDSISTRKSVKKASRVSPIEAIRYVEQDTVSIKRKKTNTGPVSYTHLDVYKRQRQYIAATGRVRGADDVIAYHVRQSFCPGEITPEEANRLGVEFAKRFTKGNHAFVVCTHIDLSLIHIFLQKLKQELPAHKSAAPKKREPER